MLDEVAAPHIESFNALFEDGGNAGLLQKAIDDIAPRVVFDGIGPEGQTSTGLGNRLEREHVYYAIQYTQLTVDSQDHICRPQQTNDTRDATTIRRGNRQSVLSI